MASGAGTMHLARALPLLLAIVCEGVFSAATEAREAASAARAPATAQRALRAEAAAEAAAAPATTSSCARRGVPLVRVP